MDKTCLSNPQTEVIVLVSDFAQNSLSYLDNFGVEVGEDPVYLLFAYLCGGDGGTTLDSQSGFSHPLRRGRESSKFRTTLTAAQPRDRNGQKILWHSQNDSTGSLDFCKVLFGEVLALPVAEVTQE